MILLAWDTEDDFLYTMKLETGFWFWKRIRYVKGSCTVWEWQPSCHTVMFGTELAYHALWSRIRNGYLNEYRQHGLKDEIQLENERVK